MRILCFIAVLAHAHLASAGPKSHGWLPETELVATRDVELGGWIYERVDRGELHERASVIGWAPTFGVSDRFELRLPFELTSRSALGEARAFAFSRFGVEARVRFTDRASSLAPILRLALVRDVELRTMTRPEAEAILGYDRGPIHVQVAAGLVGELNIAGAHWEARVSGGGNVRVLDELRLGAELYSEISFDTISETWTTVGPSLAMRVGASSLSAVFGFGIRGLDFAPRLNWGLVW